MRFSNLNALRLLWNVENLAEKLLQPKRLEVEPAHPVVDVFNNPKGRKQILPWLVL